MQEQRTDWAVLPNREGTWLYLEVIGKSAWIVRVYQKDGKAWMVKNGCRQRIRYGLWFPLGPVPSPMAIIESSSFDSEVEPDA